MKKNEPNKTNTSPSPLTKEKILKKSSGQYEQESGEGLEERLDNSLLPLHSKPSSTKKLP
jgi:hypothetical protein